MGVKKEQQKRCKKGKTSWNGGGKPAGPAGDIAKEYHEREGWRTRKGKGRVEKVFVGM